MLLGYARVSTDDQDLALQRASLKDAGCRKIFEEKVSGAKRARAELDRLLQLGESGITQLLALQQQSLSE